MIADLGYLDPKCSKQETADGTVVFSYVRARHEATNKRLKHFKVLAIIREYLLESWIILFDWLISSPPVSYY